MRVVVIGGTGHIGGHLVPMLVRDGIPVVVVSRGETPAPNEGPWTSVQFSRVSYKQSPDAWKGDLQEILRDGDTLIDILGSNLAATYEAARDRCAHVINCGSVWMLGTPRRVPYADTSQNEFWDDGYKSRWKVIQEVMAQSQLGGPGFTAILPPNISGPGKIPLETKGGRSIEVHKSLARGETVLLPEGADVLIGPCDAEDIARAFHLAVIQPQRAAGQIFNVGSAYALTATEFVETYARIYGVVIPIQRVPWTQFAEQVVPNPGSRYHFEAHMCPDICRLRERLGYDPRFTPEQSLWRAVDWMRRQRLI